MTSGIQPPTTDTAIPPRPALSDIDVFGLTDRGHVRKTNNDHFLVGSFHRTLRIHGTSITRDLGTTETQSRGFLLLVADGVGGLASAGDGSALALSTLAQHLLHATEICSELILTDETRAIDSLRDSVMRAHRALIEMGDASAGRPATTLTLFAAFWPRAFAVHVGDSRLYRLRDGELTRITSDQTYEQLMLASGAIKPGSVEAQRLKNILWSALGNDEVAVEVTPLDLRRDDIHLLCTDGLTKHVSDDEIRDHLRELTSSEATCRSLVDLTLARGGSDNVTVVIGRVRPLAAATPAP